MAEILFLCAFALGGLAIVGLAFMHPDVAHSVRSWSLSAAGLSAVFCTYAFMHRPVVVRTVEKPVVVTRELTPQEGLKKYLAHQAYAHMKALDDDTLRNRTGESRGGDGGAGREED